MRVILKNENQLEDMCSIMDSLHDYVPTITTQCTNPITDSETFPVDTFHKILFGGDQLTCARARGAQRIMQNHDTGKQQLEGLIPVIEDWHAKQCLLSVSGHVII